ncbi:galactokinase [Polyangium jinanense]|uniref:Galactokinase n=1 Tax=Polyangium jinanense TaxID=2829994 RepID=A0A9X3XF11_9BACT|nr:galactokinase [Polyangium jinanense]MDC3960618.1 galactokinase [Polyangium jinanense]MDC3986906.1 galactokinase [Polyangium jinanense]
MRDTANLRSRFHARFGARTPAPRAFFAPGRVNLIGEHTDYNDGFVLPVALELGITLIAAPRDDRRIRVYSQDLDQTAEIDLDRPGTGNSGQWVDYIEGVAHMVDARIQRIRGADLLVAGDVPWGAGLSSSAALEIGTGFALLSLAGATVDRVALALAGQAAEHTFVGTRCGIMDQRVSACARAGSALLVDCRSLAAEAVPLPSGPVAILVTDTRKKHALATSEYNTRRAECERGVALLQSALPDIRALRDVTEAAFAEHASLLPEPILRRVRHVVTENARTQSAADALRLGDIAAVGASFLASHRSLQHDYEVSCPELDALVDLAVAQPGVYGARMTGGGFGGSTVSLVDESALDAVMAAVRDAYQRRFGVEPSFLVTRGGAGARELDG